nr:RNA pseudouridine synthase [Colwellia sp.]
KEQRSQAKENLVDNALVNCLKQLAQQSINDKNTLRDLKHYWAELIEQAQQKLSNLTDDITQLKNQRKRLSIRLQKKIFQEYRLLNSAGIEKDLMEIFQQAPFPMPPAGTGDCAAPKLLQYAFKQQLKPLAMAEFWWGKAPKSEIRQHKKFYGACSGKCQPILTHMLEGMAIDDNPLLVNPALGKSLEIVYQDDAIVVVNKPSEFLSVPGKNIEDSVYLRIKQQFPQATGSLIVHRLDMSTSGLMVLALTKRAQKNLQQQFINRTIKKRYVAILEGDIQEELRQKRLNQAQGDINLPLCGDFNDRPRQRVCFEQGKSAKTQWQIIDTLNGKTKLYLYPETGRTHQLRVHCAHPLGLNMPILGDDLYGGKEHGGKENRNNNYDSHSRADNKQTQRLHLHAQKLTLSHPITKEVMTFEVTADF